MKELKEFFGIEGLVSFCVSIVPLIYVISNYSNNVAVTFFVVLFFFLFLMSLNFFYFSRKNKKINYIISFILSNVVGFILSLVFLAVAKEFDETLVFNGFGKFTDSGPIFSYAMFKLFVAMSVFSLVSVVIFRIKATKNRQEKKEVKSKRKRLKEFCSLIGINKDTYYVLFDLDERTTLDLKATVLEQGTTHNFQPEYSVLLVNIADGFCKLNENTYNYTESVSKIKTTYRELVNDYIGIEIESLIKKNDEIVDEINMVKAKYKRED